MKVMTPDDLDHYLTVMFGDNIQDPERYPRQFEYQVRLAMYEFELDQIKNEKNQRETKSLD